MSAGSNKPDGGAGNFVREIIAADQASGRHGGRVATRFPPEPNGYLHIGHAKAICVDFGLAQEFGGTCNLRFDDTNPTTEDVEYVEAIQEDIRWLGLRVVEAVLRLGLLREAVPAGGEADREGPRLRRQPVGGARSASTAATSTRRAGRARTATARSPRAWTCSARMRAGEFPEGAHVLRAKIDLETQNMNMRDPVLYRIRYAPHHRTGNAVVHLPDVRLRASAVGRDRGDHALDLHAGVRVAPPALRLVHPRGRGVPVAADRVRAPEPDLHGDVQAQARRAGAEEARLGLGRSAHADAGRAAAPRLHARGDPRLLRADRRRQDRQHRSTSGCWSTGCATI